jgi:hypothetical protein
MPRRPKNNGQAWTNSDDRRLASLYKRGEPIQSIAKDIARSVAAVYQRISVKGIANRRGR